MLFLILRKKYQLFFLLVSITFSVNAQVVLNEIYVRPDGLSTTAPNGLIYTGSKEYIELYNKGCSSIDISGYFIAMKTNFGPQGGVIRIPLGTSVGPGDHYVITSAAPAGFVVGNTDLGLGTATSGNYCVIGTGLRIVNLDGWIALYNSAGTPIDLVYWSAAAGNITSAGFAADFDPTMPLCNPTSGSPTTPLLNAKQIFNAYSTTNPGLINYIPLQNPVITYRTSDGATTWFSSANYTNDTALGATINKSVATGNCNGGTCVTPPLPSAPIVTTPVNYCQNATASALTATPLSGGTLNWYGTDATGGTASTTAPIPSTVSVGTTTYYVSQTIGGCESPRAPIVVNVTASASSIVSCGTPTTTSVTFNWTAATGATGYTISYQVNAGTPINLGAVGNIFTRAINSLNSGDSITLTLTPTGAPGTCFTPTTFSCATIVNNACGACATPTCPIVGVSNYSNLNFSAGSCNTWSPQPTNTTLTNYYLAQSDAAGFLGIAQQASSTPGLCIVRSAVIRPLVTNCNAATNISPSVTNANGVASGFNPEWYGLLPNTQYVVVETIILSPTCSLTSLCTNYYGCSAPSAPTIGSITQPTCTTATASFQITGYNAANTYTFTPGVVSISATGLVTANANTYTFTVRNAAGCVSPASGNIVVNVQPSTPSAPTIGSITQPTCTTATASFQITGYNAANTYTFTPGVVSISATGLVTANANTYTFTARNAAGCVSPASANIVVNAQPSTPSAPTIGSITQPTCTTATASFQITGYNAANTYAFTPGVVSISATGLVTANANTYTFTVRNAAGCVSPASPNIVVNAQPSTPSAPTIGSITQPTCTTATASFQITGYNAANTYTFTPGVVGISATGLVTANANTYTFTVTNTAGCISPASASILVNAQPSTPSAPAIGVVTQPTCTIATGSFQITGYNLANTYTFTPGVVSISATGLVTANANTYTFTVRNTVGCISLPSANIVVNTQPSTPAPTSSAVTQPTCTTVTGSFQIIGYNAANTYTFTPGVVSISPIGLVTANANTYTFTVTNAAGCTSLVSANILVNAQPTILAPTIGSITQPTCTIATSSFQITGYNAANTYTFTPGVVSISAAGLVTANANTYTFTVRNAAGCVSPASANIVVNAQPSTPSAPTIGSITQPTCTTATASFQITGYNAANTYTFTPGVVSISTTGLVTANTNTYTFTVRNAAGCVSPASANIVVNAQPSTPSAPTIGSITQPTCTTATASFQITGYNAANTYTFTPGVVSISATGLVTANANTYTFTVRNAAGCVSPASANIVVNAQPSTPSAPTIGSITQPTCTTATASFQITGYNAANTYTFTPGVVSISATGLVTANANTYTFTVTNTAGCISPASASILVNAQPSTPSAPTIGSITQPTCTTATASFQITGYNAANTYTFTPGVVGISATGLVTANANTYTFTVTNTAGCISPASASILVNAQPSTPSAPAIGVVTQPTCTIATGSFQITGYNLANTYTFTPGVVSISPTGLVTANANTYTFTVTNAAGCVSPTSANIVVNAQPSTPSAPTIGSITQPTCTTATASFQITGYNAANTYTFTPGVVSISATGLVTANDNTYTFTVRNTAGCVSPASGNIVVNAQPSTPSAPTIGVVTQPTCTTASGNFQITGYNAVNTYTFTPGVVSISATGLVTANANTYTFTVTNTAGCISPASASVLVNAQPSTPSAPAIGSITQPTCTIATGSFQITGYNLANTYTFTPGVVSISATGLVTANANTYTFTVRNAAGCISPASASILVNAQPSIPTLTAINLTPTFCSGGTTDIQLTSNVVGTTFSWTVTGGNVSGASGGSGSNINQTLNVIAGTTTTAELVYTIIAEANSCAGAPEVVRVRVNPIPVVTVASSPAPICSGGTTNISFTGTIPGTVFTWLVTNITGVVGASSGTGNSIQQILTTTGLSQGVVKYEITPTLNGCTGTTQSVTVLVNPRPELFANPTHPPICSGVLPTNIFLSSFNTGTVFSWTVNAVGVNGANAGSAIGPTYTIIQNLTTSVNNVAGFVDYVITPTLAGCSGTPFTVRVVVNPLPRPVLNDGAICVDELGNTFQTYVLNSGLDNATYDFLWYFNGVAIPNSNNATYTANAVGTYGVIATNSVTNCASQIVNANITATTPVSSFTVIQSEYFSDNATITVNATGGSGNLIYSLDAGLFQFSNVFSGVSAGTHTVTVEDTDGCTYLTQEVVIIDYPRFFTPNGDGYNDTWNVAGLSPFASAVKIYIFDRYGKLLKQIGSSGLGWDGTYNGNQLPSDDYWFTIDYPEQNAMKQFRAHFSLKR